MKLMIIRHGDPDYAADSLTEKGWREAELLKKRMVKIEVKDFYCSPLGRAQDTAKPTLTALNRTAETCDWLREFAGYIVVPESGERTIPWDLKPDFWTRVPNFFDKDEWINTPIMQSGSINKEYNRVCSELDKLLEKYGLVRNGNLYNVKAETTDTVVFFCHFGVECVLLSHLLNISPVQLWQGFVAQPSSVTVLATEEREKGIAYFRCSSFGDISHLYAGDEEPSFQARFCETYSNFDERH